jgi:NodT family efflux transporter outer membrane factor (OMF) lipoprotein
MPPRLIHPLLSPLALSLALLVGGCAVGPDYRRPDAPAASAFKEAEGWKAAEPSDALDRGEWWTLFGDTTLNELVARVNVSNQNIAAAQAAYDAARALVREQRASLFPSVSLDGSFTRRDSGDGEGSQYQTRSGITNSYQASIGASWEVDVWGRIRRNVEAAGAAAQASAADLASARLSAQGELVTNYLSLRESDAEMALLQATVEAYQRALQIAQNRYKVGVAPKSDLLSAQTQLYSAQADLEGMVQQRQQLEHAIATLVGVPAAQLSVAPAMWNAVVPTVPLGLPSSLLERRPDIASAERAVAQANANIGVARAAYFPTLTLSSSYGSSSSTVSSLLDASTMAWSVGASAAQTLFDFGARKAAVRQSEAQYRQTVASYRQAVLTAFQDVEDQLTAARVLERQHGFRRQASEVADENEQLILNQYRAGQVSYSEVVTAQASALSARRSLVQLEGDRQTTAVALIQAIGGGWKATQESLAPSATP